MAIDWSYRAPENDALDRFGAGFDQGQAIKQDREKRSAISSYLPAALNGDRSKVGQIAAVDPKLAIDLDQMFQGKDEQARKRSLETIEAAGQFMLRQDGTPIQTPQEFDNAVMLLKARGVPEAELAKYKFSPQTVQGIIQASQTAREYSQKAQQFGLQKAQFEETKRSNRAAEGLAAQRAAQGPGGRGYKPLPATLQKAENEYLGDLQNAGNIAADTQGYLAKIQAGELNPSLISNAYNDAKSWAGVVDENDPAAIAYNDYRAFLEKMRNDSLLLNKGVQTEGDAQRAWQALFRGMNSTAVVKAQLEKIVKINERAARQKAGLVRNQRKNYFGDQYEDPDWADLGVDPSLFQDQQAPQSFTRGGAGIFSNDQAGQAPSPAATAPSGWQIKKIR